MKILTRGGTASLECQGRIEIPGETGFFSRMIVIAGNAYLVHSSGIYRAVPSGLDKVFAGRGISAAEASGDRKYLLVLAGHTLLRFPVENAGNRANLKADAEIVLSTGNYGAIGSKDGRQIFSLCRRQQDTGYQNRGKEQVPYRYTEYIIRGRILSDFCLCRCFCSYPDRCYAV